MATPAHSSIPKPVDTLIKRADWKTLVACKPGIHAWPPGQLSFFALPDEVLEFIARHCDENSSSLETGLGASTIVFAAQGGRHVCITPAKDEIERITQFFETHKVGAGRVEFVPDYSEWALPRMTVPALDMALIDGRHGFPAPMIDWFYISKHLRTGGTLLVDDVHLWPVHLLVEYLSSSSAWRVDREFERTIAYTKVSAGDERADWVNQANVEAMTSRIQLKRRREQRMRKMAKLAKSGRFDLIAAKAFRKLLKRF